MRIGALSLIFLTVWLLCANAVSQAQTCLQLIDSIEYFKSRQKEKTVFYGESLMQKLDLGECNLELGLTAIYNNLGLAFWEVKDQPNALYAFSIALAYTPSDSLDLELLDVYYNLSGLHQELGEFDVADDYLRKADLIVEKEYGHESLENVYHLLTKGIFYREIGKFNESLTALTTADELGTSLNMGDSVKLDLMIEIGTTYRHFGDLDAGEEMLIEAIEMTKHKDQMLYLTAVDRLSSLLIEQGEYSDSENYLLHNLEVKTKNFSHDSLLVLETLNGLGLLYYKINDIQSAHKHLENALRLTEDQVTIKPYMMNNLGAIMMREGDIEQALKYFQESANAFRDLFGSMHPDYASCLNNLASAYKESGDLGKALDLYMKVLDMDKVIYGEEHQRYATSLNNIALVYMQLGNNSLAGKLLVEAKAIREAALGTHHPLYIKSLNDLGLYHLIEKDTIAALNTLNEALTSEIKHIHDIFPVLTRQQRQLYFKEAKNNVERFCSLVFAGSYLQTEWAETALNHFINTRGVLFYASDKMRKLIQSSKDEEIKQIFEEWRNKKYKLAQAYLLSEEERQHRGISIEQLEEESDNLEKNLSLRFAVFSEQEQSAYYTWQDIAAALPDSSVALDIVQYRDYNVTVTDEKIDQGFEERSNYVSFLIKADTTLTPIQWSRWTDFNRGHALYSNLMKFGFRDTLSYETFWKPIDDRLPEIKRIYMAPDGIYYKLNPAAFLDPVNNEYVSDKYDIINITSTKDLLLREPQKLIRRARIFGNPAFTSLGEEYVLDPLPGAEREANDITKILDVRKWETKTYYYSDATETNVKELNNPGVVHIATHGYFEEDPTFTEPLNSSGLYLSRTDESEEDGVLSAYEAMNLVLDKTSLVVLAACETGLGTVKNGEGVFGLQRAFLVAGADHILISLVKINDQSARRFMNLYYEQLRTREDPQEAFFMARSEFKKEETNPYNWGAFLLVSRN